MIDERSEEIIINFFEFKVDSNVGWRTVFYTLLVSMSYHRQKDRHTHRQSHTHTHTYSLPSLLMSYVCTCDQHVCFGRTYLVWFLLACNSSIVLASPSIICFIPNTLTYIYISYCGVENMAFFHSFMMNKTQ